MMICEYLTRFQQW